MRTLIAVCATVAVLAMVWPMSLVNPTEHPVTAAMTVAKPVTQRPQYFEVTTVTHAPTARDDYTVTMLAPPPPPVGAVSAGGAAAPVGDAQAAAYAMVRDRGWGDDQFSCLVKLWQRESNWNHTAMNRSSGAYGIPQSLPGSKMASAGADWQTNPATQIRWGLGYIEGRYGTPCGAWAKSERSGWY